MVKNNVKVFRPYLIGPLKMMQFKIVIIFRKFFFPVVNFIFSWRILYKLQKFLTTSELERVELAATRRNQ